MNNIYIYLLLSFIIGFISATIYFKPINLKLNIIKLLYKIGIINRKTYVKMLLKEVTNSREKRRITNNR